MISLMNTESHYTHAMRGYIKIYDYKYIPKNITYGCQIEIKREEKSDEKSDEKSVWFRHAEREDALILSQIQINIWHATYHNIIDHTWLYHSKHMTISYKYRTRI